MYISIDKTKLVPSQDLGCMQFFLSDVYTRKSGMQWGSKEISDSGWASGHAEELASLRRYYVEVHIS
jgi:hypothetical protein